MLAWIGLGVILLGRFSLGKVLMSVSEMSTCYDFVVVGGGTAGNVIANRLTEDPDIRVLVIESGGSGDGALDIEVPFLIPKLFAPDQYSWNFTTTPQAVLGGRSIIYHMGHVLGGSSSTNGMVYARGSVEDHDRIANITGDEGWSWDGVQHYIRKHERWSSPNASTIFFDASVHSSDGMTAVSLLRTPHSIDDRIRKATEDNDEFPFTTDYNSGKPLGFGWQQNTITSDGRRESSVTSYLGPRIIERANLHVLLNHRVLRLLPADGTASSGVHFNGVEFMEIVDGIAAPRHVVTAYKEIILSAGSIGTPHILLHSGIGDSNALSALGIKPIHHLPSVGQNVTEQPSAVIQWFVNDTNTSERFTRNATLMAELLNEWKVNKSGPLTTPMSTHLGFLRLPDNATIFETVADPSAGANTPHIELFFNNGLLLFPPTPTGNFLSVGAIVVTPMSRGSISLKTSNPLDQPLIDPAMLVHEFDRFALREAFRRIRRFIALPAWDDYILKLSGDIAAVDFSDDDQLDGYFRHRATTAMHAVGSASMSPRGARWGVTDPDLKLKGVRGIRIVDASVIVESTLLFVECDVC